jgi:HrpA-like RNA helicase
MTEFPLAPRQSRIIVEAIMRYPDVLHETLIAAAFLSTQSPYILPPGEETDARKAHHSFRDDAGDFVSYLKLFKSYRDSTNKIRFCEKNYLDERAMAEIVNVVAQLEEILASLQIPVHSAGIAGGASGAAFTSVDDYLCCIGRGMIQFVCVREGAGRNGSYRSLTADRISIHPGSVMFRTDPPFIVAGEIVRTSRMYAMSVSPLSRDVLERIRPGLFRPESGKTAAEKLKKPRDFTNNIRIAGSVFEIKTIKGKKTAILPWEQLAAISDKIPSETVYKGLKGCVVVNRQYSLLAGEKLELILSLAPALDAAGAINRQWPRKAAFNSRSDLASLLDHLEDLVKPAIWKKGAKELGFLGLFTNGEGSYRFRCSRGFHTSLNESLASLEALIDELGDDIDASIKQAVNLTYRRLSDYLG